jgi:TRAP transporter TAXI family solute receptor
MRKIFMLALVMVVGISLVLTGCTGEQAPEASGDESSGDERLQLTFYTGPMGGSWVPLGGAMAAAWREDIGFSTDIVPGGGMLNITAVEMGDADIGFLNSVSGGDGWNGVAPFDGEHRKQAAIVNLYAQYWQAVALPPIESYGDLAGKVLGPSPRGHTGEQMSERILSAYDLSYDDLAGVEFLSYADTVSGMRDGHIDAMSIGTTVPAPSITEIATARDINFISLEEDVIEYMEETYPGVVRLVIPAGTYPGQTEDQITVGWNAVLFCSIDLDEEIVYQITQSVFERKNDLIAVVSALEEMSLETWAGTGVPLHPGAARYYKEQGVDVPESWIHPGA